jgi:hypothetical protein
MAALTTAQKETYTFRDHKANNARVALYLNPANTTAQAAAHAAVLGQDMYALYTGDTQFFSDGATPTIKSHGVYTTVAQPWSGSFNSSGDYLSIEDKAVFVFQDASGSLHRYQIPAPEHTIFLSDQETIDTSQTVVRQFIADMLAATYMTVTANAAALHPVTSAQAYALTAFVGGLRIRRKQQRKVNIYTKNPALSGPAE